MSGFNYVCGLCNTSEGGLPLLEIIAIVIGLSSLVVSVLTVLDSRNTQKKNEAYLRYSYWLNFNWDILNRKYNTTAPWRESHEKAGKDILKILDMFEKEFPDPTK